jgi:site-specific recombinase XerD
VIGRVLSIPPKRFQRRSVSFLTTEESQALIDAPPQDRWEGRRDRAMLTLTIQAGLRVSELVAVNCGDVTLGTGGCVQVEGKGRKHRAVPLTNEAKAVLTVWIAERRGTPPDPLFPTRTGRRLSRDAVERRVATHVATASNVCTSLTGKRVHPHVLRHSCAMALLQAGVDSTVIALWLGHADVRSTQPYIHADMTIKERALALVTPASVKPGHYTPSDDVLAFLESLG